MPEMPETRVSLLLRVRDPAADLLDPATAPAAA